MEKMEQHNGVSKNEAFMRIEAMRQFMHSWGNVGDEDDDLNAIRRQLEDDEITPVQAIIKIEALEQSRNFR